MRGHLGSGIEPVSPALAGRFFTTESPGKPRESLLNTNRYLVPTQGPLIKLSRGGGRGAWDMQGLL